MRLSKFCFVCKTLILLFCCLTGAPGFAQQATTGDQDALQRERTEIVLERLQYIQNVLSQKLVERSELGERIEAANEQDQVDLRRQADEFTRDIQQLRITLESIATGGVDTSLFVTQPVQKEGNWQEDISLIAQPVIDSLKELTEKPRKLKELNESIGVRQQELDAANLALENLQPALAENPSGNLQQSLNRLHKTWSGRRDDALNAIEIAQFQIADLRGDKTLTQSIVAAVVGFIKGRGLTIVLAAMAASIVWFGVRFLLRGYRATIIKNERPESRTRYRVAAYSVHALTGILILIAIFVVLYQRGDVLLLGLLVLLIFGLALGVRQLLPQYIREARLLLNIGAMREAERITFYGLPWRVENINMYTTLHNPELSGSLRIPLAEFHGINSRPSGSDSWFPTSLGDFILVDDDELFEVIEQNPDTVELKQRGGQITSVPAAEFYTREMTNLTRGGTFSVTGAFRLDYKYQSICLNLVPETLQAAISDSLSHTDLATMVVDVNVELEQAAESSIDYWLLVTVQSKAANSYLRIRRLMQSACIQTCAEKNWEIPYPHIVVAKG